MNRNIGGASQSLISPTCKQVEHFDGLVGRDALPKRLYASRPEIVSPCAESVQPLLIDVGQLLLDGQTHVPNPLAHEPKQAHGG